MMEMFDKFRRLHPSTPFIRVVSNAAFAKRKVRHATDVPVSTFRRLRRHNYANGPAGWRVGGGSLGGWVGWWLTMSTTKRAVDWIPVQSGGYFAGDQLTMDHAKTSFPALDTAEWTNSPDCHSSDARRWGPVAASWETFGSDVCATLDKWWRLFFPHPL